MRKVRQDLWQSSFPEVLFFGSLLTNVGTGIKRLVVNLKPTKKEKCIETVFEKT